VIPTAAAVLGGAAVAGFRLRRPWCPGGGSLGRAAAAVLGGARRAGFGGAAGAPRLRVARDRGNGGGPTRRARGTALGGTGAGARNRGAVGEAAGLAPLWSHKAALLAAHWTAVAMLLAASRSLLLAAGFSAAVLLDGGALGYLDLFLTPWQIGAATEPP
jgi:hypothetical protein